MKQQSVLTVADVKPDALRALLARYGLFLKLVEDDAEIPGSFWGAPEAGIAASLVYVRADTPVHSLLHETCHVVCMCDERREQLMTDAGGDDLEECAVCYLQILLADHIAGVGRDRLMRDMDTWGYSFRLGNTRAWYENDADDARNWLIEKRIIDAEGAVNFTLRG